MLSDLVRLNHIKRETFMTWRVTLPDRIIIFLNSVKVLWMHQFCSKCFLWIHPFWRKKFWIHPFWKKFSLDAPILKKTFLWMHPFWRKVFSGYTHFEKSFLWMHPFWVYMGDWKTVPPNPPTTTTTRTTLSSPWSVGFAADKKHMWKKRPRYIRTYGEIPTGGGGGGGNNCDFPPGPPPLRRRFF